MDVLQRTVGAAENVLLSILGSIQKNYDKNVVVILDDVEHIIGGDQWLPSTARQLVGSKQQTVHRLRFTLLAVLNMVHRRSWANLCRNIIFVLTSSQDPGPAVLCVDHTFYLEHPDAVKRLTLLSDFVGQNNTESEEGADRLNVPEHMLQSELAESFVGKSYSEMVQYCRQAIESVGRSQRKPSRPSSFRFQVLEALKQRLQTMTPDSLRCGVTDDYVEMRVFTAKDLVLGIREQTKSGPYLLPMRGASAYNAWKALEFSIVIPLCRSRDLQNLLNNANPVDEKKMVGGLLLHGESGSGKSSIVFHCARYAAQLLPSIKLVHVNCTSLVHKEVGGSEEAIHRLFKAAHMAAPCILLLDGLENIASVRGNDATTEGTMDRMLSTLLVELDGATDIASSELAGVAVVGITHDEKLIDPALKRPGRLSPVVRLACDWN